MKPILALLVLPFLALAQSSDPSGLMTNQRVVQLVQSGLSVDLISRVIAAAPSVSFNLAPVDTDQLALAGVSEETVKMMSARENGAVFAPGRSVAQAVLAEHGYNVTYDGGSVASLKGGSGLKLYIDGNQIRFVSHSSDEAKVVTIPAAAVTEIS